MPDSEGHAAPEPDDAVAQPAVEPRVPAVAPALEGAALGGSAAMARRLALGQPSPQDAHALRALAPHVGNAAVNRYVGGGVLSRQGPGHAPVPAPAGPAATPAAGGQGGAPEVTIGPAIWSWQLNARARPVEAAHIERTTTRPGGGIAYKDDTMRLSVGIRGLTAVNQADHFATMMSVGETQVDGLSPTFTGTGYEWNLRLAQMGRVYISAMITGPNDLEEQWTMDLTVSGDLTDYKAALERTSDLINADILSGGAGVNDAATAYKAAHDAQKAVLDKEAKNRQMVDEMLWSALFAGLGGLTGGAVGAGMGKALGDLRTSLAGGAAIDAAKDVTKSLTKSVLAMGKPAGSIHDPQLQSVSTNPFNFLQQWEAAMRREGAFLLREVAAAKDLAGQAENEQAMTLFSEDPYAILSRDRSLQYIKTPMSADPKSYTRALWEQWLGAYGYEFIDEHYEADPAAEGPSLHVDPFVATGVGRDSKLEEAILDAATNTGMSAAEARAWYEQARQPALERVNAQLAQRRAGQEPTPFVPGQPPTPTGRPEDSPGPTGR